MQQHKNQRRTHEAVLVKEVIDTLGLTKAHLKTQVRIVDATVGGGGHSAEIIKAGACVLGIDADSKMLKIARENLKKACPTSEGEPREFLNLLHGKTMYQLVHGNFRDIDTIAKRHGFTAVDGILFDLGVSNVHFASKERGFSFKEANAPLDMRLDRSAQKVTAADLVNGLRKDQLQQLFEVVMKRKKAAKITKALILRRKVNPIKTVGDFCKVFENVHGRRRKLHPATLPLLALRIVVNSELENLKEALPRAFSLLKPRGRLAVISFHSGEDAIAKRFFKKLEEEGKAKILTRRPILPTKGEVVKNPKARSAKLRAVANL